LQVTKYAGSVFKIMDCSFKTRSVLMAFKQLEKEHF